MTPKPIIRKARGLAAIPAPQTLDLNSLQPGDSRGVAESRGVEKICTATMSRLPIRSVLKLT